MIHWRRLTSILLAAFGLSVTGCAHKFHYGVEILPQKVSRIVTGKTTRNQVVMEWGDPVHVRRSDKTTTLIYEQVEAELTGEILTKRIRRLSIDVTEKDIVTAHHVDDLEVKEVYVYPEDRSSKDRNYRDRWPE